MFPRDSQHTAFNIPVARCQERFPLIKVEVVADWFYEQLESTEEFFKDAGSFSGLRKVLSVAQTVGVKMCQSRW